MKHVLSVLFSLVMTAGMLSVPVDCAAGDSLRVGHFPNFTHAQPLIGRATGIFEKKTGKRIDWKTFNAGPSEMEALIAGELDIAYVGPNPALNAYIRSKGRALKIIAGAAGGGASFIIRKDVVLNAPKDLSGRRVASPELGNTQDVALRTWLKSKGLVAGKDVQVLPVKNPDILLLFLKKDIDGAWVPEPWATRLLQEAGGRVYVDEAGLWPEGRFSTAVLVARADYLAQNRDVVGRFLDAHIEITDWINKNPEDAKKTLNRQLETLIRKPLPDKILDEAFKKVSISYNPFSDSILTSAVRAWELGYLPGEGRNPPRVEQAFDLTLLNGQLRRKKLPEVKTR